MKKIIIFFVFLVLGIYLFAKVIIDTGIDTIIDALSNFSLLHFLLLCALTALNFVLYAYRWDVVLKHFEPNHKVPFKTLYMSRTSGYAVSYLTPSAQVGGEPVRIFFLRDCNVKMSHAVASVVVDKVLESTAFILLSIIGVALGFHFDILNGLVGDILWKSLIGAIIFMFILYLAIFFKTGFVSKLLRILHLNKIKKIHEVERKIAEIELMMSEFITGHQLRFWWLMFLSIVNVAVYILEHFLVAFFLGVTMTAMQSFLVTSIPNVAYLIPIPAALGALESFSVGMFSALNISVNAVALVLIIRIRDILVVFTGIVYASGHGLHMLRDAWQSFRNTK